jgi:hypothetical protein
MQFCSLDAARLPGGGSRWLSSRVASRMVPPPAFLGVFWAGGGVGSGGTAGMDSRAFRGLETSVSDRGASLRHGHSPRNNSIARSRTIRYH